MTISQNKYFKLNFLSIFMLVISLNACDDGSEPINDPIMAIRTSSGTEMAGTEMAGTEMAGTEMAGTGLIPTDGDLTITYSGSASGPLVVAAFTSWPPLGPPSAFEQETNPTYPVSVSFPQLDAGTYTILIFIDVDGSGSMSPTDADIQAQVEIQWPTTSTIEINLNDEESQPIEELEVINDTVSRGVRMTPVSALIPTGTEPLPMIVFTPGFQLQASYYAPMLESLAQEGYIVILADPPGTLFDVNHIEMAADIRAVIDWAINSSFSTRIDVNKIATMGHSLGGKLALFNAAEDERVIATLALDPVDGDPSPLPDPSIRPTLADDILGRVTGAVGLIGELSNAESQNAFSPACAPRANNFQTIYAALTNASWLVEWELIGADHMDFVSACPDGLFSPCSACEEGSMAPDRVINLSVDFASAFFAFHLRGEETRVLELTNAPEGDVNVRQR
jgi:pimeloyl-ACP methyl ester carboxylesterase